MRQTCRGRACRGRWTYSLHGFRRPIECLRQDACQERLRNPSCYWGIRRIGEVPSMRTARPLIRSVQSQVRGIHKRRAIGNRVADGVVQRYCYRRGEQPDPCREV